MNVEKTIEFLLEHSVRAELRMDRADARMDRAEARMDRAEARTERMEKHLSGVDKRLAGIDKRLDRIAVMMKGGMQMLRIVSADKRETDFKIRSLADAQQRTETKLERLMDILLRKNTNGRRPPKQKGSA